MQATAFLHDPGRWADPVLAADWFVPGLDPATVRALLVSPRTAARASRLLAEKLGAGDWEAVPEVDRALLLAGPGRLSTVVSLAGAVWHAGRVRALVLGADIAALAARHGEGARRAAMRHAALASTPQGVTDASALAEDIARDGAACVGHWTDSLPAWASARLGLIWPRCAPTLPDAALAARIVRAVAPMAGA